MMSRAPLSVIWILGISAALGVGASARSPEESPSSLTAEASKWYAALNDDQRDEVLYEFDDDERFDLRLAPIWLEGLRRDDMTGAQWQGLREVLQTTLTPLGMQKVETVMSLENEVRRLDEESWLLLVLGRFIHGQGLYYVALFGEPKSGQPWGMRLDGHHVSLNWTVDRDGMVSTTPLFLGSQPREVPQGWERAGLRALAEEEDAGRALWKALGREQRAAAEIEFAEATGLGGRTRPLFVGEGERLDPFKPIGISSADLDPAQRQLLGALVEAYLARLGAEERAALRPAETETLHFAWAGSLDPGAPGYYRVQGKSLLIEFDNTVPEGNHVHTIVRDVNSDYGRDLLARHYDDHH